MSDCGNSKFGELQRGRQDENLDPGNLASPNEAVFVSEDLVIAAELGLGRVCEWDWAMSASGQEHDYVTHQSAVAVYKGMSQSQTRAVTFRDVLARFAN